MERIAIRDGYFAGLIDITLPAKPEEVKTRG